MTSVQTTHAGPVDAAVQECENFTIALDRFVFNRLQPVVDPATDLLHSQAERADPAKVAGTLMNTSVQLAALVEELDLMGVPPREIVGLLLSIREGTLLYTAAFEKGARGWESGDTDLIREAKAAVQEASAAMTEFFGWQLCG